MTNYFCVFSLQILIEVAGIETVIPRTFYSTCNSTATENESPDDTHRENYQNVLYNYADSMPKKTDNIQ